MGYREWVSWGGKTRFLWFQPLAQTTATSGERFTVTFTLAGALISYPDTWQLTLLAQLNA